MAVSCLPAGSIVWPNSGWASHPTLHFSGGVNLLSQLPGLPHLDQNASAVFCKDEVSFTNVGRMTITNYTSSCPTLFQQTYFFGG